MKKTYHETRATTIGSASLTWKKWTENSNKFYSSMYLDRVMCRFYVFIICPSS